MKLYIAFYALGLYSAMVIFKWGELVGTYIR